MKKKTFKRAGAAVLSMAMLLSFGAIGATSAYAASTIKVNGIASDNAADGNVSVYEIAYVDENTGELTVNSDYSDYKSEIKALTSTTTATDLNALAHNLKSVVTDNNISATETGTTGTTGVSINTTHTSAYYLVLTTDSNNKVVVQPALVQVDKDGTETVLCKANPITLQKKIIKTTKGDISQGDMNDSDTSVGIVGSKVTYKLSSQIPSYDTTVAAADISNYVIRDNPSVGLDITNGVEVDETNTLAKNANVKVYLSTDNKFDLQDRTSDDDVVIYQNGAATEGYTGVTVTGAASDGFKVTVPGTVVATNQDKYIFVTFDATVTEDAVLGDATLTTQQDAQADEYKADANRNYKSDGEMTTGNPNIAYLSYGNNFSTGGYANSNGEPTTPPSGEEPETPSNIVTTYIGDVDLTKYGDEQATVEVEGTKYPLFSATVTVEGSDYSNVEVYKDGNDYKFVADLKDSDDNKADANTVATIKSGTSPVEKKAALTGATFRLTNESDANWQGTGVNYKDYAMTGVSTIDFGYLPAGTYTLTETAAPANHKVFSGTYKFVVANGATTVGAEYSTYTITADASNAVSVGTITQTGSGTADYDIAVIDPPTDSLPGTGGMGTILFTVGGAAIVLLAGTMFVIYMKKRKVEE